MRRAIRLPLIMNAADYLIVCVYNGGAVIECFKDSQKMNVNNNNNNNLMTD